MVFCIDRAGITGDDGASHHGVLDMVLLSKVPGMTIFAPSSYRELGIMLHDALELCVDGPSALRWPKTLPVDDPTDTETGSGLSARKVRSGTDLCILSVGKMLGAARDAARLLAEDGIDASVWDVRLVKPLDEEMLADAARHRLVITVEDGYADGGAGAAMAERVRGLTDGVVATEVIGIPTTYIPQGKPDEILAGFGLDAAGIRDKARTRFLRPGPLPLVAPSGDGFTL